MGNDKNTEFIPKEKVLILNIDEEIDHHTSDMMRKKLDNEITRYMPRKVILDFEKVTFMDSAGIGMVLGRYKMVKMLGGNMELRNVSSNVRKIFDMSGITKLIG